MTQEESNYLAGSQHREQIRREINANPIRVDRSVFTKTAAERATVQMVQSNFKRNGLYEWNVRNRPGNNK